MGSNVIKRLLFNAFSMNCVSHIHHGLWARQDTRQLEYCSLEPWIELAKILENGCFDALFLADVLRTYDVFGGNADAAVKEAMQIPANDPKLLIPAMARETENLGFAFTGSIYAEYPFNFARTVSTLDHLSSGRIAWNIVTSYLPNAARNLGYERLPLHDKRYDRADEYMEVLYKLWEGSWEEGAVLKDTEKGIYADPKKVHPINHKGTYYEVAGPHLCEPSPQRTPVLFQAGSSERGREFAARHSECVFVSTRNPRKYAHDLKRRVSHYGRKADDIRVFLALSLVTGGTEEEARLKARALEETLSIEGGLIHASGTSGVDLASIDLDKPISDYDFNHVLGFYKDLADREQDKTLTFRDIARSQASGQWLIGSDEQVADKIEEFSKQGVDGFNLLYTTSPGTFVDFIEGVAPILKRRGLMQDSYSEGSLRRKIFGESRLPSQHEGAAFRRR